jgi:hypothetical protein
VPGGVDAPGGVGAGDVIEEGDGEGEVVFGGSAVKRAAMGRRERMLVCLGFSSGRWCSCSVEDGVCWLGV